MPISNIYLDDDHNVVPQDLATILVESETDDQGRLVTERLYRIVRPGSQDEELVEIVQESERIAAEMKANKPTWLPGMRVWVIVAIVVLIVVLWLLSR